MRAFQIACLNGNRRTGWLYHPIELWVLARGTAKQNPFWSRLPLASAGAWNWFFSGALCWSKGWIMLNMSNSQRTSEDQKDWRAAWIGLVFLSMAPRSSRWAAVLVRELPRRRQETRFPVRSEIQPDSTGFGLTYDMDAGRVFLDVFRARIKSWSLQEIMQTVTVPEITEKVTISMIQWEIQYCLIKIISICSNLSVSNEFTGCRLFRGHVAVRIEQLR